MEGFGRIWKDWRGFGRIWKDLEGFERICRIWKIEVSKEEEELAELEEQSWKSWKSWQLTEVEELKTGKWSNTHERPRRRRIHKCQSFGLDSVDKLNNCKLLRFV